MSFCNKVIYITSKHVYIIELLQCKHSAMVTSNNVFVGEFAKIICFSLQDKKILLICEYHENIRIIELNYIEGVLLRPRDNEFCVLFFLP